jgi:hypothetical protein
MKTNEYYYFAINLWMKYVQLYLDGKISPSVYLTLAEELDNQNLLILGRKLFNGN